MMLVAISDKVVYSKSNDSTLFLVEARNPYNKEFVSRRRIISNDKASLVNVVTASHACNGTYYGLFPKCFVG